MRQDSSFFLFINLIFTTYFKKKISSEFHKEGSIILKSRMPSWGPRKIKSNAHFYSAFKMVEEEVKETNDPVIEQLFVEVFKDKDAFVETMIENLKKVEEVEIEMTGGIKRAFSEIDECAMDEPEDLDTKINELLNKFEGKDLVYTTKFFKVISKSGQPYLAIAHPRVLKKAGYLGYQINFKGYKFKTDCAALTNLDSEMMGGRKHKGPAFCTLVPNQDLGNESKKLIYDKFDMDITENDEEIPGEPSASQDFPFTQSQTEETIKVCQVCRFATRDKAVLREHLESHYQCETCYQFYASRNELEHHLQNHMKETCGECKKKVRKDEMMTHKMNHMQLKSFGKKVLKQKPLKPVKGYGLWQKEERVKIVENFQEMNFNEVSSELGKRWKLVDAAGKTIWKKRAMEYNKQLKANETASGNDPEDDGNSTEAPGTLKLGNLMIDDDDIMPPNTLDNDVEVVEPDAVELENLLLDEGELENLLLDDVELENLLLDDDTSILPNTIDDSSEVVEPVRKKNVITVVRSNNCPLCDFESENSKALSDHIKTKYKLTQTRKPHD